MGKSDIAWCTDVWNPTVGCSRASSGCGGCYAERMAHRLQAMGRPEYQGLTRSTPDGPRWTGTVRLVEERLDQPRRWRKPRRIFVDSMSDLFHESLSHRDIARVWRAMEAAPHHQFMVLTKRAERMQEWVTAFRENRRRTDVDPDDYDRVFAHVWLGVSVEDQATADARISLLLDTPATTRLVSAEPLIGPVDFDPPGCPQGHQEGWSVGSDGATPFCNECSSEMAHGWWFGDADRMINWVICGGESGPGARRCDPKWIHDIVQACKANEIACFVKQLGSYSAWRGRGTADIEAAWVNWEADPDAPEIRFPLRDRKGGDPSEWPEPLRVQEWPA